MSSANMQLVRVAAFRSQAVIIPQQQLVRPAALVIYLVIHLLIAYLLPTYSLNENLAVTVE